MALRNYNEKEAFSFYKSFEDYVSWSEKTYDALPQNYSIRRYASGWTRPDKDFVGSNNLDELNNKLKEFQSPKLLDNSIAQIQNLFSLINLGGAFDKDRMVATDMPIGVFDFSLASKGLYKAQEYFCPELGRLINPDFILKIGFDPDVFIYTEKKDDIPKSYSLIQQQEGTNEIRLMNNHIEELVKSGETREMATELSKIQFPKAKLIFKTTTKKVNLVRRSKTLKNNTVGNEKYVDLFLRIGGNANETPRSLLYRTMPSLLVAYFLNKAGIKTRILGLDAIGDGSRNEATYRNFNRYMNSYVIKEYDDPFDFNEIAILSADSRTFRWRIFKSIACQFAENFKYDIGGGLGNAINGDQYLQMFERYKTFYIEEQKSKTGVKNLNSRLMFTTELSVDATDTDEEIMVQVEAEFFRLIDAIDIEFNGSKTALPRIKQRELARGVDISNLRQRLTGSVATTTAYDDSDSPYSATEKQKQERIDLFSKLKKDIDATFKTI
jgi:hypothetical protein